MKRMIFVQQLLASSIVIQVDMHLFIFFSTFEPCFCAWLIRMSPPTVTGVVMIPSQVFSPPGNLHLTPWS